MREDDPGQCGRLGVRIGDTQSALRLGASGEPSVESAEVIHLCYALADGSLEFCCLTDSLIHSRPHAQGQLRVAVDDQVDVDVVDIEDVLD